MNRELAIEWMEKVSLLSFGEELYIPASSRREQRITESLFNRERKLLAKIDPLQAAQTHIYSVFRDQRFWVVLKKMDASPSTVFIKGSSGKVEKLSTDSFESSQRFRRLRLMLEDGLSETEILEIEGELSDEERRYLGL
jgi:hypothetical protein